MLYLGIDQHRSQLTVNLRSEVLERRRRKLEERARQEEARQAALDALFHNDDLLDDEDLMTGDHDLTDGLAQDNLTPAAFESLSDHLFAEQADLDVQELAEPIPSACTQNAPTPADVVPLAFRQCLTEATPRGGVTLRRDARPPASPCSQALLSPGPCFTSSHRHAPPCGLPESPDTFRQAVEQPPRRRLSVRKLTVKNPESAAPPTASRQTAHRRPGRFAPWLFFLAFTLLGGGIFWGASGNSTPSVPSVPAIAASVPALDPASRYVTKEIRDIRPGDLVLTRDENGTEIGRKRVAQVFRRTSDHLRILTFRSPDDQCQTIKTTNEHPFWVENEARFVNAAELEPGDTFTGPNGELQHLVSTEYEPHPEGIAVFNFEVEEYHTYYVAENGARAPPLLTHNTCEYVYQHFDADGNVTYIGKTNNLERRAAEHALDKTKRGTTMRAITGALNHDEARTIEARLIYQRLKEAQNAGLITGSEPIAEQLKKAGLDNLNRGRDPSRWLGIKPEDVITPPGDPLGI